ncbi:MAG: replication initiation protein [Actinomycetota bacterium]|nr:replication initiation protein [Actinomycetota bacterium]
MSAATFPSDVVRHLVCLAADDERRRRLEKDAHACHYCAEPIRLKGYSVTTDAVSGEILESVTSLDAPQGQVLKACGTRRATRCPSCARIYQGDARHLVAAGIRGGKGVAESVASHPFVFATITAPSFGRVHRRAKSGGPCQARRPGRCVHGRAVTCLVQHDAADNRLGAPLCSACYDTEGAVLFNAHLSELWRRTAIYTKRHLARLVGLTAKTCDAQVRLSYVKVAEFQHRGLAHVHVVVRLDARDGGAPPTTFTAELLALALRIAAGQVRVPYPEGRGEARWGEQVECTPLDTSSPSQVRKVANYLAKYSTKGSDEAGALDRRIGSPDELAQRRLPRHLRTMATVAWDLGDVWPGLRLRQWAHTLGLRSHFLTKSRWYSTTFRALREARRIHLRTERLMRSGALRAGAEPVVTGTWSYGGQGWRSRGERTYVILAGRRAEEARRLCYDLAFARTGGSP